AERFRFAHPTPDDLLAALAAGLGRDAVENARAILFEGAGVNYSVRDVRSVRRRAASSAAAPDGAGAGGAPGAAAGGRVESRVVIHREGELRLPVSIVLTTAGGERIEHRWDGRERDEIILHTGAHPVTAVRVDPDDAILI